MWAILRRCSEIRCSVAMRPRPHHPRRKIRSEAGKLPVDENVWRLLFLDPEEHLNVGLSRSDDQRVDAARKQLLDLLLLEFRIFFRGRNNQVVTLLAQHAGHAFGYFAEERMHQVRDDQANTVRPARDQRAGGEVGPIVHFLHAFEDAVPGFGTDIGVVAQHFGNCDNGDSQIVRDVLHAGGHGRIIA